MFVCIHYHEGRVGTSPIGQICIPLEEYPNQVIPDPISTVAHIVDMETVPNCEECPDVSKIISSDWLLAKTRRMLARFVRFPDMRDYLRNEGIEIIIHIDEPEV